jgi:acetyl-CoA acetyltransferase
MLEKTGMTLGQIDQVEINEAFAAQTLACQKEWGTSQSNELTRVSSALSFIGGAGHAVLFPSVCQSLL